MTTTTTVFSTQKITSTNAPKKKLAILQSKGGYGHVAACNTLNNLFKDYYDIKIVTPIEELFGKLDYVKRFTRGKVNAEDMYNAVLSNGWIRTFNAICNNIVPMVMRSNMKNMEHALTDYLNKEKPDMLISTMPFVNLAASNAAQKLNIPFLIVTVDGGLHNWRVGLNRITHPNYLITIGFDIPQTRGMLHKCGIPDNRIKLTGMATRDDFFEVKDLPTIRKKWNVPDNKFTIMILMGGAGGQAAFDYLQKIASTNLDAHLLVCTGRNKSLHNKIEKFVQKKCPPNISVTIVPFTTRVSDLMAVSDLLITKPGPGSINEGLIMKLPLLIDRTSPTLFWEQANIDYVESRGYGKAIKSLRSLPSTLEKMIHDKEYYQSFKKTLHQFPQHNFAQNIKPIVFNMCPPTQPQTTEQYV